MAQDDIMESAEFLRGKAAGIIEAAEAVEGLDSFGSTLPYELADFLRDDAWACLSRADQVEVIEHGTAEQFAVLLNDLVKDIESLSEVAA